MHITAPKRAARIRALNDAFRQSFVGGKVNMTAGIDGLDAETVVTILEAVQTFTAFDPGDDPHGEHDFGSLEAAEQTIFFKIDYYGPTLDRGSEDPSDPAQTTRVLTIMLASEY